MATIGHTKFRWHEISPTRQRTRRKPSRVPEIQRIAKGPRRCQYATNWFQRWTAAGSAAAAALGTVPTGKSAALTATTQCRCCHKPKFHLARLDTSSPMHFGCVDIVKQRSSTRRARLARYDESDWQFSLLCNFYKVMITVIHLLFNVRYSLIYWF